MRRYIALLRGVNISGKNKVPMAELKLGFESLGFSDVRTWLNSGNVVFSGEETESAALTGQIEGMIQRRFGLEIPVFVLPQEQLADTLRHAPDWWGTEDPEVYDNLIFILPPASFQDVYREMRAEGGPGADPGLRGRRVLVLRPEEVSENELVAENGQHGGRPEADDPDGEYRPENCPFVETKTCEQRVFMITIYVYTHDTMADWEIGHVTAELHSGRFFKQDAPEVSLKTVGISREPVTSMGGLTILPDCVVDDIAVSEETVLLLPGGNTWDDSKHSAVIRKAAALLSAGGTVGAICGATAALARAGLLDNRPHTSNGAGFLEMFCPGYKGQPYFVDAPSVADGNLITAGGTGALLWAKQIIGRLGVFRPDTLEAWYAYFSTGEAQHFFALMQTLPSAAQ